MQDLELVVEVGHRREVTFELLSGVVVERDVEGIAFADELQRRGRQLGGRGNPRISSSSDSSKRSWRPTTTSRRSMVALARSRVVSSAGSPAASTSDPSRRVWPLFTMRANTDARTYPSSESTPSRARVLPASAGCAFT
jgi:hypothetical protein